MRNCIKQVLMIAALFPMVAACSKKSVNEDLFNASTSNTLTYYQGVDSIYSPGGNSPHGTFKLRFNATASSALDGTGRLPVGNSFPEGSLIVKELFTGNTLTAYAVMKRDKKSKFNAGNWIWAEYKPDGTVQYSVAEKGGACLSCHSGGTNRDLIRSFDLH